jgi:hypothetical protein
MVDFKIETAGLEQAIAAVKTVAPKELNFIMALALTETARDVEFIVKRAIQTEIDRPRAFTINSLYATRATKNKLEAVIRWKDFATKGASAGTYLQPLAEGGGRKLKRSESLLKKRGLLPAGYYLVPGKDADLDQYGNIRGGIYTQMLSALQSFSEAGFSMNRTTKTSKNKTPWFVVKPGQATSLAPGIYQRLKTKRRLIFAIVKAPTYGVTFPFYRIATNASKERMPVQFWKAVEKALTTGRFAVRK